MSENLKLGQIITTPQQRDAIHIAVVPAEAIEILRPGEHVSYAHGKAASGGNCIGVVDPFLRGQVQRGQTFWVYLYPGSITSLRHDWTHPYIPSEVPVPTTATTKSESELWMRDWAVKHMGYDYYGDEETLSAEQAYANAIGAGHRLSVGPYESARDHIDDEWWSHWEAITGQRGDRGEYFSCAC